MIVKSLLIYLADDDKEDRTLFKEALNAIDEETSVKDFENGVVLMDHLLDENTALPHVIYLDLNMPLMNGEECLNDIKNEYRLSNIPIIIYSTHANMSRMNEFQKKGVNFYLVKPNSFEKLKILLRKSLEYLQLPVDTIGSSKFVISQKRLRRDHLFKS